MTGYHPKVGKHYKHNKLDPQSAEFMPLTGNPEIDANIEKARNKKERDRKLKILLGKSTSTPKKNKKALKEGMTTSGLGMINLPANEFDVGEADDKNADVDPSYTPDGTLSNGTWTMNNAPDEGNSGITISLLVDLSRSDTFSTQIYFDNATIDPAHGMDVVLDEPGGQSQIIPISVPGTGS